jgi:hypothetical protein
MTTISLDSTIAKFRTGAGSNQRLVLLDGGPHGFAAAHLIPEASVLVGDRAEGARIAAELASRPQLDDGQVIHIRGFGPETYVARRVERNRDWWRLVPVGILRNGQRFYPEHEGTDHYVIRDAGQDGKAVATARDRDQAADTAKTMNDALVFDADDPAIRRPRWDDYLKAIGKADQVSA